MCVGGGGEGGWEMGSQAIEYSNLKAKHINNREIKTKKTEPAGEETTTPKAPSRTNR